ncbi:L-aspartate oxidase [Thalassovita gelatinovora]|uniref:L-aspartate oxidase n=1 Tax=Thalassovita gelatinovora TaxID=53501 RepID=A0A0P1G7E7_THAGE|nr:L-aspartate oxidase [Thalassovita gelatinovora]QIZ82385.1 L-aspartate oxidase [Thalassovita gelatinovora]CUH68460.1 L-aspartate oxidase [Thalassovita gelatinovora]SEQ52657.1 L-aspartate oxidase [Thalassovita gelatinovora]
MQAITTDRVVIVGAGMGALYAALKLAPRPVLMISPETLGEGASSAWAQGGIAAAMGPTDSPESHSSDTLRAGAGTVDPQVATQVTREARDHILDLTDMGTPFDRDDNGGYVLSREAAHSFARVVRVKGDQAGAEIMKALIAQALQTPSIQVLEGVLASGLEVSNGAVTGVWIETSCEDRSQPILLRGAAYLMAGGGSGGLYKLTTNPARIRGQVIGMAARAGAVIADAEFVQFHPTAIDMGEDPAPLATEALRGEGATLINADGERFMTAIHPDAELAPRDIVARAIYAQTQAGKRPMLDTRAVLGAKVLTQYPAVAEACARAGIDPVLNPIPVAAAAHYHMGGIATDQNGRASLKNLWVCGEASSTGLHGANRLASNGLLEALVYARICAVGIDAVLGSPTGIAPEIAPDFLPGGVSPDANAVDRLRRCMTNNVGVVRDAEGLKLALATIARLEDENADCPGFVNMTATATLIAAAALLREESRGAHYRSDFPAPKGDTGKRSMLTLSEALALRDKIAKETA